MKKKNYRIISKIVRDRKNSAIFYELSCKVKKISILMHECSDDIAIFSDLNVKNNVFISSFLDPAEMDIILMNIKTEAKILGLKSQWLEKISNTLWNRHEKNIKKYLKMRRGK